MSTKHLRAVIETGIEAAQRHSIGQEAAVIMDRARRELEAIERAAPVLVNMLRHTLPGVLADDEDSAWTLLERIAKDVR